MPESTNVIEHPDKSPPQQRRGGPDWDVAWLESRQGSWTEEEYLAIDGGPIVEFDNGFIEVHSMATLFHQAIVLYLYKVFDAWVRAHVEGEVFSAPMPIRLWTKKFRDPDVTYLRPEQIPADRRTQPRSVALALEVVSPGEESRKRDLEEKPEDYARAGIEEYWIVDPEQESISVLKLAGDAYELHGEFGRGETATSVLLDGLEVDVDAVFAAGEGRR